jgi:hypothetical protein
VRVRTSSRNQKARLCKKVPFVPRRTRDAEVARVRMGRTEAPMVDGRWGDVELTEAVDVTLVAGVARRTVVPMLVRGETVRLGATGFPGENAKFCTVESLLCFR